MPSKSNSGFVRVDDLMARVTSVEQVARFYGVELPAITRVESDTRCELRSRCYLNCGRTEPTSERALAIQMETAGKVWRCFASGCGRLGNLLGLMDLLAPGQHMNGKPRGERFKELARDLEAIVAGRERPADAAGNSAKPAEERRPERNAPLAESANERARELVSLDEQFVYPDQLDAMPPAASRYFRERAHFLTSDLCRQHRVGYLPQSAKSLLRGKIVYPYFDAAGNLLTWFGRNPGYDEKHRRWSASDRSESEPQKFQFVKGFLKGLEIWGEHIVRLGLEWHDRPLVIVEGPNDCLRLQQAGVPAVALCAHAITAEQVERVAALAADMNCPVVHVMLDNDAEGTEGLTQVLPRLCERLAARVVWSQRSDRAWAGRQPESLTTEELDTLFEAHAPRSE